MTLKQSECPKDVKKPESLGTADENVKWCSLCGKWRGTPSKCSLETSPVTHNSASRSIPPNPESGDSGRDLHTHAQEIVLHACGTVLTTQIFKDSGTDKGKVGCAFKGRLKWSGRDDGGRRTCRRGPHMEKPCERHAK